MAVDSSQRADLACPQTGGVDQLLGDNPALFGDNLPTAIGAWIGFQHRVTQHDFGALHLRSPGIGMRGAGRIEVAV